MATKINKTPQNLSFLFEDVLKKIWKEDKERDWTVYFKELQFAYF